MEGTSNSSLKKLWSRCWSRQVSVKPVSIMSAESLSYGNPWFAASKNPACRKQKCCCNQGSSFHSIPGKRMRKAIHNGCILPHALWIRAPSGFREFFSAAPVMIHLRIFEAPILRGNYLLDLDMTYLYFHSLQIQICRNER